MPKKNDKPNAGAADPTADDTADKPTHNVINTTPDPVGKPEDDKAPEGVMNTTDSEYDDELQPRRRELSEADRKEIKRLFNQGGAVIANIASKFDIEPSEVFAIAEGK